MIWLLLTSLFQVYLATYVLIFKQLTIIQIISEIGFLIQSIMIFTLTIIEWSYQESQWLHRAYKAAIYISIITFGLFCSIFLDELKFTVDGFRVLIPIVTTLILIEKYKLLYKP